MTLDHLARQIATHSAGTRRGLLAALAGLLSLPATSSAQEPRCSPRGGGCTLLVPCCGNVECVRSDPLNPNSGVCGGIWRDTNPGPAFISPTSGDGNANAGSGASPSHEDLIAEYDLNGDGELDCEDFPCWEDAQAFLRLYPDDPFDLDGDSDGEACEANRRCQD